MVDGQCGALLPCVWLEVTVRHRGDAVARRRDAEGVASGRMRGACAIELRTSDEVATRADGLSGTQFEGIDDG